jgi:hypothetical protein
MVLAIQKPDYTTEDFPIFSRFGWGGADSPEFSQARRDAYRLAFGEPDKESRSPSGATLGRDSSGRIATLAGCACEP